MPQIHRILTKEQETKHLSECLTKDRIITNVIAEDIDSLLEKFAELFSPEIARELQKREKSGTTSVGKGYAVPHARIPNLESTEVGITTTRGTDFNSPDNQPVYIAFGIIVPALGMNGIYLSLLGECAKIIECDYFNETITKIKNGKKISPNEIYNLLLKYKKQQS